MLRMKTILVPVDFTDSSNQAADYASTLARQFRAKIILMHAIEPFTYSVTDTVLVTDHYAVLGAIAQRLMNVLRQKLSQRGVKVESVVTTGTPYVAIVEQAQKHRPDMIVMGTRGRTGFDHILLGSVAERVVRLAPCPVLTMRGGKGRSSGGKAIRRPPSVSRRRETTKKR